jgi:hypothetical protein
LTTRKFFQSLGALGLYETHNVLIETLLFFHTFQLGAALFLILLAVTEPSIPWAVTFMVLQIFAFFDFVTEFEQFGR